MSSHLMKCCLVGFGLVTATASLPSAAEYPTKPIRWIVAWPPGGGADTAARVMQSKLTDVLGQQVIIDNRPGAGGNIGAGLAAKSPADGYTLLFASASTHTMNPHLYSRMPFKESDFSPVALLVRISNVLVVNPALPARNVKEFITLAKNGAVYYASSGNGSTQHLAAEMFKTMSGAEITHVPYKGGGPAVTAVIAGEAQALFADPLASIPHVKVGKLRALGTTGSKRVSSLPDVPTISEAGIKGYDADSWSGLFVPAGTPKAIIDRLNRDVIKVLAVPEVKERLSSQGYEPAPTAPEAFGRFVTSETTKWGKVVKMSGAKLD